MSSRMSSKCCACQRNINHVIHCACHEKQTTHTCTQKHGTFKECCACHVSNASPKHTPCQKDPKGMERRYYSQTVANSCGCYPTHLRTHLSHTSAHNPTGTLRQVGKKKALPWSFRSIVLHSASTAFGDACSDSLPGYSGSGLVTALFQANKICSKWTNKHV